MAEESRRLVSVRLFLGFSTDSDPFDAPPGLGRACVNAEGHDPGVLRSRNGYETLSGVETFPSGITAYRSLAFYDHPDGPFYVGGP